MFNPLFVSLLFSKIIKVKVNLENLHTENLELSYQMRFKIDQATFTNSMTLIIEIFFWAIFLFNMDGVSEAIAAFFFTLFHTQFFCSLHFSLSIYFFFVFLTEKIKISPHAIESFFSIRINIL